MTDDLIERLRRARANGDPTKYIAGISVAEAHEAADALAAARAEIKRLREQRDRLREALRGAHDALSSIDEAQPDMLNEDEHEAMHRARSVLLGAPA